MGYVARQSNSGQSRRSVEGSRSHAVRHTHTHTHTRARTRTQSRDRTRLRALTTQQHKTDFSAFRTRNPSLKRPRPTL
jgi:hypothetical protein